MLHCPEHGRQLRVPAPPATDATLHDVLDPAWNGSVNVGLSLRHRGLLPPGLPGLRPGPRNTGGDTAPSGRSLAVPPPPPGPASRLVATPAQSRHTAGTEYPPLAGSAHSGPGRGIQGWSLRRLLRLNPQCCRRCPQQCGQGASAIVATILHRCSPQSALPIHTNSDPFVSYRQPVKALRLQRRDKPSASANSTSNPMAVIV